jgi:ABC-type multidrug transport system ATPase subunit
VTKIPPDATATSQQHDVLIPVPTVEATVYYSALLDTTDDAEAKKRAKDAIEILGLQQSAETWVGNAIIRGLSGGQRRRLSVGVELVRSLRSTNAIPPTQCLHV